jgi:hypothetical protein
MNPAFGPTLTDADFLRDASDLGLIARRVLDLLIVMPERRRFLPDVSAPPLRATRC